jgi:eukaryotic-like serine/threonine-protein kinase
LPWGRECSGEAAWVAWRGVPATERRISLPARYRVVRHIADGGMAAVWAAEDELLGRLVAVKVLSPAFAADERAVKRFQREARAGARLSDHRHVVTVYDIGEHDGRAFMVMEYLPGGTVADRLKSGRTIPRAQAVHWLRDTADALDSAQALGIVHRDVKPANLLLDERGRLAVGDFGIAKVASEASVTMTGQVLGTAAYISPEQALGRPATPASDRYALAVVAYELLTGERPFRAQHAAAQARAHVDGAVPLASEVAPLPAAVDEVLQEGLAKEPADRPRTAGALVDGLERALGHDAEPVADPTETTRQVPAPVVIPAGHAAASAPARRREPRPRRAAPPPAPSREHRGWPALVVLGLIALVVGAVVAIAAGGGGGGDQPARSGSSATASTGKQSTPAKTQSTTQSPPAAAKTQSSTAPAAGGDPTTLNNQGFALINQGKPADAVPLLQRAVQRFRDQGRTGEIDYAYALFNLGNALRLSGRPADAIPYLQERLRISDFKTAEVQRELDLARRQAGITGGDAKPGKDHGKAKKG